jgi:hypothetical protein
MSGDLNWWKGDICAQNLTSLQCENVPSSLTQLPFVIHTHISILVCKYMSKGVPEFVLGIKGVLASGLMYYYCYFYRYSALGPFRAETRAQSGDWYGSGSLPLLSPAFRRSHFRHQVPHVRHDARDPSGGRWNCGRECCPVILPKWRLPRHLGFFYMPQIYDRGPKALLPLRRKECGGFFSPLKIRRLRPGLKPRTWVLKAPRPPKPLVY